MPKELRENKFSCFKCIKYQNVIFKLKILLTLASQFLCGFLMLVSSAKWLLEPTYSFPLKLFFPKPVTLFHSNILGNISVKYEVNIFKCDIEYQIESNILLWGKICRYFTV